MLGLEKGFVKMVPHNEKWHQIFEEEKLCLKNAIGNFVEAIEHIGSTSICGIAAKSILDIAISVKDKANGEKCVAPLEKIGYIFRGENGIAGRFYFVKGEPRTRHLHLLLADSDEFRHHLFFRNYLRCNPNAAAQYDKLKKELARNFPKDRDSYLEGKAGFIEKILKNSQNKGKFGLEEKNDSRNTTN